MSFADRIPRAHYQTIRAGGYQAFIEDLSQFNISKQTVRTTYMTCVMCAAAKKSSIFRTRLLYKIVHKPQHTTMYLHTFSSIFLTVAIAPRYS